MHSGTNIKVGRTRFAQTAMCHVGMSQHHTGTVGRTRFWMDVLAPGCMAAVARKADAFAAQGPAPMAR